MAPVSTFHARVADVVQSRDQLRLERHFVYAQRISTEEVSSHWEFVKYGGVFNRFQLSHREWDESREQVSPVVIEQLAKKQQGNTLQL
jgi:hypothetical protein